MKQTVDPLILEGTDDAPAEESDETVADVLLRAILHMSEVGGKDSLLVVGSEHFPNLLLRSDVLHNLRMHYLLRT